MIIVNRYLNGLYRLFRYIGHRDPELGVIFCIMLMQVAFVSDMSIIFRISLLEKLDNKWIIGLILGLILYLINIYIFGIRESIYTEYPPLSKLITFLITVLYFAITISFIFYASKNR